MELDTTAVDSKRFFLVSRIEDLVPGVAVAVSAAVDDDDVVVQKASFVNVTIPFFAAA